MANGSLYGNSNKTSKEWNDIGLHPNAIWVLYIDLRCIEQKKLKRNNLNSEWFYDNGTTVSDNLYAVLGQVETDVNQICKGTDVIGRLPDQTYSKSLSHKFDTNNEYKCIRLSKFSACQLYGNKEGIKASRFTPGRSNLRKKRFHIPFDHFHDMIQLVNSRLFSNEDDNDILNAIQSAVDSGNRGHAKDVVTNRTAARGGRYVSEKSKQQGNRNSNRNGGDRAQRSNQTINQRTARPSKSPSPNVSRNVSRNGSRRGIDDEKEDNTTGSTNKPKGKKGKNKPVASASRQITETYQVTLSTGQVVNAKITYTASPDTQVVGLAKKSRR